MFPRSLVALGRILDVTHLKTTRQLVREHTEFILGWLSGLSLAFVAAKAFYYFDWLSLLVGIIGIIGWICIGIMTENRVERARRSRFQEDVSASMRGQRRVWQTYSILAVTAAFVLMPPITKRFEPGDVWVLPDRAVSSISRGVLYIVPFWTPAIVVSGGHSPYAVVSVKSADGMPLKCTVQTYNVVLDTRNAEVLESFLVQRAKFGDPNVYFATELQTAVVAVTNTTVAGMTVEQISAASATRFFIPYHVGTPLYSVLERLHLRFIDGEVRVGCVPNFQS